MTVTRPAPVAPSPSIDGFGPPPEPRGARSVAGALLGVLLIVFCGAAVAVFSSTVGHRRAVLIVARPVDAGAVIQRGDLGEARVAADVAVHTIPAADRARVVGRVAGANLLPGTLLVPGQLADGPSIGADHAVVGLALKTGQFPLGLRALDRVVIVDTGPPSGPGIGPATVLVAEARITAIAASADGQTTAASVLVPRPAAPTVTAAGARGQVSVILVGGG